MPTAAPARKVRSKPVFKPRLTRDEAHRLTKEYDVAGDVEAEQAGERLMSDKPSVRDVHVIFEWKTRGRGRSRLAKNSKAEILDAIKLAKSAETPRAAIAVLRGLHGVDVPVASAFMTMMRPKVHTVIDFRALEALGYDGAYNHIGFYLAYLDYCAGLAKDWGMLLRQLDRALWQWSSNERKRRR